MANTIRIGTFEVSSFKVGLKDPKIYLGDILLYPTGGYKVCYAVVNDITQYTDREYEDVYDKATEKWYKLNNLNQYEEYGIYGSGRTSCEGSSRLPQGYTEVEYIENTGTSYINTDLQIYSSTTNSFEVEAKLIAAKHDSQTYQNVFSCMSEDGEPYQGFAYRYNSSSLAGTSIPKGQNTFTIVNNEDSTQTVTVTSSSSQRTYTHTYPLTLFCGLNSSRNPFRWTNSKFYYCKIRMNNELVRYFVPANRDSDDKYGMYDIVNDVFYTSPNGNNFIGGEPVTPTDCVTTYNGKLTIDDGYEYEWNGSSWDNLGEVSGSSITIKSPEYIEKNSSHTGYCELLETFTEDTKIIMKHRQTVASGASIIGDYFNNDNDDWRVFFASSTLYYDFITQRKYTSKTMPMPSPEEWEIGNYYIKNTATGSYYINGTQQTFSTRPNQMYLYYLGGFGNVSDYGQVYYIKIYRGETLVRDFIPWTDMNGNYGLYDKVENELVHTIGNMTASTVINDVTIGSEVYPKYYSEKSEPLDSLTFNTLEEAQAYAEANCVYVGLKATIDGDKYVFSGDSQSGYEWVYNPSRLPIGYTEVEYIQNTGTSYFNTNFKPNTNTRIVADMQQVTANDFPRLFGCNNWNATAGMNVVYEGGNLRISWFGQTSWTQITSVPNNFDRHIYDLNKNNLYVDETLVASTTYSSSYQSSDNLGIFFEMTGGRPGQAAYFTQEVFKGKMYSFQIYDNGTLVRDLVPCVKDSDNTVGAYDIVNDVFYTVPTGYTTDKLVAGDPV